MPEAVYRAPQPPLPPIRSGQVVRYTWGERKGHNGKPGRRYPLALVQLEGRRVYVPLEEATDE